MYPPDPRDDWALLGLFAASGVGSLVVGVLIVLVCHLMGVI